MEQVETKVDVLASRIVGRNEASTDTSEHPVDVLAVMADYSAQHGDPEDFEQARAAIAELVEAAKAVVGRGPHRDPELHDRLHFALVRVGGAK